MQKKDFWKGFGAAFVLLAVIYFGGQFLAQMNIALPFGMSNTAKICQIEEMLDTYYVEDYDKELAEELMYTGLVAGVAFSSSFIFLVSPFLAACSSLFSINALFICPDLLFQIK